VFPDLTTTDSPAPAMNFSPSRSVIPLLLILSSLVVLVATDADRSET
jgi:hypothetical protein